MRVAAAVRVLVLGVGPLPDEARGRMLAPGLRLDFVAHRLAREGFDVTVGRSMFDAVTTGDSSPPIDKRAVGYAVRDLPLRDAWKSLRAWHRATPWDAVVALTDVMANAVARAGLPVPWLADTYGDVFAERQMQGLRAGNDDGLRDALALWLPVLLTADRFGVCADAQRHALLGQLGMIGRLNRHTAMHEMIDVIRAAWRVTFPSIEGASSFASIQSIQSIAPGSVLLGWSGGFNNWTDVDTLVAGANRAMEREPALHVAIAGGAIPGHSEHTYTRFESLVAQSPHRDRWHLLGWLDAAAMPAFYDAVHLCVNIDAPCPEGEFGSRTRLLDWAHRGLPTVTTPLCELAARLVGAGGARAFAIGDVDGLASAIATLARDASLRAEVGANAQAFVGPWIEQAMPASLLAWLRRPTTAPDLPSIQERRQWFERVGERPEAPPWGGDNGAAEAMAALHRSDFLAEWRADQGSRLYGLYRAAKRMLGK